MLHTHTDDGTRLLALLRASLRPAFVGIDDRDTGVFAGHGEEDWCLSRPDVECRGRGDREEKGEVVALSRFSGGPRKTHDDNLSFPIGHLPCSANAGKKSSHWHPSLIVLAHSIPYARRRHNYVRDRSLETPMPPIVLTPHCSRLSDPVFSLKPSRPLSNGGTRSFKSLVSCGFTSPYPLIVAHTRQEREIQRYAIGMPLVSMLNRTCRLGA